MRYFTWKLEFVSNILCTMVGRSSYDYSACGVNWHFKSYLLECMFKSQKHTDKQKQPSKWVLKKRYSETNSRFTEEDPCRKVISMNLQSNFIEITYGCSPLNELCIFRTSFPKNTSGGLVENIFPHQLFVQRSRLELRLTFTVNINVHYWGYVYPKCWC